MNNRKELSLYPLKFEPIYQYKPWGGRRLRNLLEIPLPGDGPVGEAWLLSDREEKNSLISNGPLRGMTLRELLKQRPEQVMGKLAGAFPRFPLLLKFLDVQKSLSVQVHPSDKKTAYIPIGETGKTEAWVVLNAGPKSRIYAGLKPATTPDTLRHAAQYGKLEDHLASFVPKIGSGILIPAGTVHSLSDAVVFEVQQNSDVTFRLYDWNHIDPATDGLRPLQFEQALACINFAQDQIEPITPTFNGNGPIQRERIVSCAYFELSRLNADHPFPVGVPGVPKILVALSGHGRLVHCETSYSVRLGDVFLFPSVIGECLCRPEGFVTMLEISIPESPSNP